MSARAPLGTVFGNLVIGRDLSDVWVVFRVRSRSYRSEPRRKQRALVEELEAFCWGVEADFQILLGLQALGRRAVRRRRGG